MRVIINKNKGSICFALIFFFHCLGCVYFIKDSDEDLSKAKTRIYEGVSEKEIFAAAEKIFKLADGDEFAFYPGDKELSARRKWSIHEFLHIDTFIDNWKIQTFIEENGVRATIQVQRSCRGLGCDLYNEPITTEPYELFWSRMDYLLGKRKDWVPCPVKNFDIGDDYICGPTLRDHSPDRPRNF